MYDKVSIKYLDTAEEQRFELVYGQTNYESGKLNYESLMGRLLRNTSITQEGQKVSFIDRDIKILSVTKNTSSPMN